MYMSLPNMNLLLFCLGVVKMQGGIALLEEATPFCFTKLKIDLAWTKEPTNYLSLLK